MKTATWKVEIGEKLVAQGVAEESNAEAAETLAIKQIMTTLETALWRLPWRTEHVQHTD